MSFFKKSLGYFCVAFAVALVILLIYPIGINSPNEALKWQDLSKDLGRDFLKKSSEYSKRREIGLYVINLDNRPDRMQAIEPLIEKLPYNKMRLSAVYGKSYPRESLEKYVNNDMHKALFGKKFEMGTIGCALSHYLTWVEFLASNNEYALILEDDISFDSNTLYPLVEELTTQKARYWDIVNLENLHSGHPLTVSKLSTGHHLCVYLTRVSHSGAYLINRAAAGVLLKNALPMKVPLDHYFTRSWEYGVKFTGIEYPRVVHQSFGDSDIVESRRKGQNRSAFQIFLFASYEAQSTINRIVYNLKQYFAARSNRQEVLSQNKRELSCH